MTNSQLTSLQNSEKLESIPKSGTTRMPIQATFIQHSIGSPSQSIYTSKRMKRHSN